ncbi:hypothetical protein BDN67DRAFT_173595 [Paxillus ammoniavirescens]|nr:hypothetical protein BDN67DRAFT_173595 [Paxillus ammoniavirescens]
MLDATFTTGMETMIMGANLHDGVGNDSFTPSMGVCFVNRTANLPHANLPHAHHTRHDIAHSCHSYNNLKVKRIAPLTLRFTRSWLRTENSGNLLRATPMPTVTKDPSKERLSSFDSTVSLGETRIHPTWLQSVTPWDKSTDQSGHFLSISLPARNIVPKIPSGLPRHLTLEGGTHFEALPKTAEVLDPGQRYANFELLD